MRCGPWMESPVAPSVRHGQPWSSRRATSGERRQFGKPLAEFQALQFKLADMLTQLTASRQMVLLAADRLDRGHPQASLYCAMAKRFATDQCFETCNEALQLHGGYGYLNDYPLER